MASKANLASDITFIDTPPAEPSTFETGEDCGVRITTVSFASYAHVKGSCLLTAAVVACHS